MNSDDEDLWRAAVNRLFDQILMLEEKVSDLESELQLLRTKPVMNRAGEEYWEHG